MVCKASRLTKRCWASVSLTCDSPDLDWHHCSEGLFGSRMALSPSHVWACPTEPASHMYGPLKAGTHAMQVYITKRYVAALCVYLMSIFLVKYWHSWGGPRMKAT